MAARRRKAGRPGPPAVSLDRLQRWMQAVVVHPGRIQDALASSRAQAEVPLAELPEVVLPSAHLTPAERLGVYHGMYLLRMQEALEADFPGLRHFLGEEGFRRLVRDYVQAHPSRSYTLNRLGDHLPEFLRTARGVPRPGFCHDLARLELAVSEVFDAAETPALGPEAIASVREEEWERARLRPVAALRLVALDHPVNAYLQAVKEEAPPHPAGRRKRSWVAVYRREYVVWRHDLTRPAHDLLADLLAGLPLGEAVAAALRRRPAPAEEALYRWFREWVAAGMFQSIET